MPANQPTTKQEEWEEQAKDRILIALNLYAMGIMQDDYDYVEHLKGFTDRIIEDLMPIFHSELEKVREDERQVIIKQMIFEQSIYDANNCIDEFNFCESWIEKIENRCDSLHSHQKEDDHE